MPTQKTASGRNFFLRDSFSAWLIEESQTGLCLPQTVKLYSGQSQSFTDDNTEKDSGRSDLLILQ